MRRWFVFCVVALAASWCSIGVAQESKVYKSWPEAEKVVQKTWRPIVAAFVQQGDSQFMGSSSSVMGDKGLKKALGRLILVQVELVKKGTDDKLGVADEKNGGLMSKLLGKESKTIPVFVVAGPDMKPLKIWERADPAVVKKEIGPVLKNAISKYKPLDDSKVNKAESLLKRAEKEEEEGKDEKAAKTLREVIRMNKDCGLAKQAQEVIDRLTGEKEDPGITEVGEDDEEDGDGEEEKKKEEKPEPASVTAVIETGYGNIEIELFIEKAPKTCEHFISLAKNGFYDDSTFGYIERGKLIQCIPNPDKKLPEEVEADFCDVKHEEGVVAMARGSARKKVGAPFYIAIDKLKDRDGEYAVFAKVKRGLIVAKTIASVKTLNYKPVDKIAVRRIRIKE